MTTCKMFTHNVKTTIKELPKAFCALASITRFYIPFHMVFLITYYITRYSEMDVILSFFGVYVICMFITITIKLLVESVENKEKIEDENGN